MGKRKKEWEKDGVKKERGAKQPFVSFSLEKEAEEPSPLSFSYFSDLTISIRRSCKHK